MKQTKPVEPVIDPSAEMPALIREIADKQASLMGQGAMLNHQLMQMGQLIGGWAQQMQQSSKALGDELQKFQTGGTQRAMAAVFHKLFRELAAFANQMDDVVSGAGAAGLPPDWMDALRLMQGRLEELLKSWGCTPVAIELGKDEFDPEVHESVAAQPGDVPEGMPEHTIARVLRRGWRLHDALLHHPQVVVA